MKSEALNRGVERYKLFTHTDLDGVGCAVVALTKLVNVDIDFCDYDNVNEVITDFIERGFSGKYKGIFVTDISVSEEVAEMIEQDTGDWKLIDHHATARFLNKYSWAYVEEVEPEGNASGTSLLRTELENGSEANPSDELYLFAEKVRRYDTWEWDTRFNDCEAKKMNDLLHIIGRERFIERFSSDLSTDFTEVEKLLLDLEHEKIEATIKRARDNLLRVEISNYKAGVVFSERYSSEVGNVLAKENDELDLIAIVNPSKSISLRTVKNIDLGRVAKKYGGGGHPKAAGINMDEDKSLDFIMSLFDDRRMNRK